MSEPRNIVDELRALFPERMSPGQALDAILEAYPLLVPWPEDAPESPADRAILLKVRAMLDEAPSMGWRAREWVPAAERIRELLKGEGFIVFPGLGQPPIHLADRDAVAQWWESEQAKALRAKVPVVVNGPVGRMG